MTAPVLWPSTTWEEIATLRDSGVHTPIEDLSRLLSSALTEQPPLSQSSFATI